MKQTNNSESIFMERWESTSSNELQWKNNYSDKFHHSKRQSLTLRIKIKKPEENMHYSCNDHQCTDDANSLQSLHNDFPFILLVSHTVNNTGNILI